MPGDNNQGLASWFFKCSSLLSMVVFRHIGSIRTAHAIPAITDTTNVD